MLSSEEVMHIAKLARITLTESEIEGYRKSLKTLMDEVLEVTKVEVESDALISPSKNHNVWFEDASPISNTEELLKNAPHRQGNFIEVERALND